MLKDFFNVSNCFAEIVIITFDKVETFVGHCYFLRMFADSTEKIKSNKLINKSIDLLLSYLMFLYS